MDPPFPKGSAVKRIWNKNSDRLTRKENGDNITFIRRLPGNI